MRIITLLAVVIISGVLVACSSVPVDPKLIIGRVPPAQTPFNSVPCAPNCTVKIDVTGDCQFSVPDLVILSGMAGKRHAVVWQIMSDDYVFSTTIGTPALDPKGSSSFFGTPTVVGPIMVVRVT